MLPAVAVAAPRRLDLAAHSCRAEPRDGILWLWWIDGVYPSAWDFAGDNRCTA